MPQSIGALASPHCTLEELYLLAKLMRGLGSENIDFRLRQADFADTAPRASPLARHARSPSLSQLERVLVVGSFLRKDHPLFAQRLRQAARKGAQVHRACTRWMTTGLMPMANSIMPAPSAWLQALADVAAAVAAAKGVAAPAAARPATRPRRIAAVAARRRAQGDAAGQCRRAAPAGRALLALANWIGAQTGASVGFLGEAANSVGAHLAGALPGAGGLNAGQMLAQPLKALLLLNAEPELDCRRSGRARVPRCKARAWSWR